MKTASGGEIGITVRERVRVRVRANVRAGKRRRR